MTNSIELKRKKEDFSGQKTKEKLLIRKGGTEKNVITMILIPLPQKRGRVSGFWCDETEDLMERSLRLSVGRCTVLQQSYKT